MAVIRDEFAFIGRGMKTEQAAESAVWGTCWAVTVADTYCQCESNSWSTANTDKSLPGGLHGVISSFNV